MHTETTARRPVWQKVMGIVALAGMGAFSGYALAGLGRDVIGGWEDEVAMLMAVSLTAMAVVSAGVMATRPRDVPRGCGLLQTVANLMLWRAADEMLRRVMSETSAMAFWALQTALFVYAAAERLGLIDGLTAWGMTGILMGVYLAASIVASARRGMT